MIFLLFSLVYFVFWRLDVVGFGSFFCVFYSVIWDGGLGEGIRLVVLKEEW